MVEATPFDATQLAGILASQFQQQFFVPGVTVSPEQIIAGTILGVEGVEIVYVDRSSDLTRVWTVIDVDDEAVCDLIYAKERELIHYYFSDRFDFHVVARQGRSLRSLITFSCDGWVRRT